MGSRVEREKGKQDKGRIDRFNNKRVRLREDGVSMIERGGWVRG